MANSLFIVLDGIDGSGKTYMLEQIHNYLFSKDKRYRILSTREPTNGTYGKQIREILAQDTETSTRAQELLDLFVKDRREHVDNVIMPFLKSASGDEINVALCDRYYHSTITFQATQGLDVNSIIEANKLFPQPDLTIILDVAPDIALSRMKSREKEKFEQIEFMSSLRESFLALPEKLSENIVIVDASRNKQDVSKEIIAEVEKILEKN